MSKVEQQVMASVGVVYAVRKLTSRFALECYALALSCAGAVFFVSLPHVASNLLQVAHGGIPSVEVFFVDALLHTTLIVQGVLVLGIVSLALIAFDIGRSTVPSRFA